jgi:hypothetical protein
MTRLNIGEAAIVHSTSWRRDRDAVILTFVVVIDPSLVGDMESGIVQRSELAHSRATQAPESIQHAQVLEHGLRHLAWLIRDDEVVRSELAEAWSAALAGYIPEPFRHLR